MALDLAPYLKRIQYHGDLTPSLATLQQLHFAHATHIPFENLDVLLGRGIRLDPESLWNKLVLNQRGGYCFEQNRLFATVLESLGFAVTCLSGRVILGSSERRPRTHMILSVHVDGEDWLADVGFGGEGLLYPLRLRQDEVQSQFAWRYRLIAAGDGFELLQSLHQEGWFDLYCFTREPQSAVDYEMANFYTSTFPQSRFRQNLFTALPGAQLRVTLWNRLLIEQTPSAKTETTLLDDGAVRRVLEERFGLRVPAETKFGSELG